MLPQLDARLACAGFRPFLSFGRATAWAATGTMWISTGLVTASSFVTRGGALAMFIPVATALSAHATASLFGRRDWRWRRTFADEVR